MVALRMTFDNVSGRRIVEVCGNSGRVVARILPSDVDDGIRIISANFEGEPEPIPASAIPPGYLLRFAK